MKKNFAEFLEEIYACNEAREWAGNKTVEEAVEQCYRGDWMLWLAHGVNLDIRLVTLAKARCAQTVLHLMEDERSRNAVAVAESFGLGNSSLEELSAAADYAAAAAYAAYAAAADYAADYAAAAAAAAAADYAADYAAADYAAASHAAAAAAAASHAAYAAAAAAADKEKNQLQTADICREVFGEQLIEKVNELFNN